MKPTIAGLQREANQLKDKLAAAQNRIDDDKAIVENALSNNSKLLVEIDNLRKDMIESDNCVLELKEAEARFARLQFEYDTANIEIAFLRSVLTRLTQSGQFVTGIKQA